MNILHFSESDWRRDEGRQQNNEQHSNGNRNASGGDVNNGDSAEEVHDGPRSHSEDGTRSENGNHSETDQNLSNLNKYNQDPSFFLSMSHTHTVQSACRCLNIQQGQGLRAVKVQYKRLARKFHPDKWHPNVGCSQAEGTRIFQCIANAYTLLRQHCFVYTSGPKNSTCILFLPYTHTL